MGIITLPTWLFVVPLALALWALAERLLVPGLRWYFRRKMNRVIQELGTRLGIELPRFKLTRRRVLIDRLFHDPGVQAAVERESREKDVPRAVVAARVDRYAREIVPAFNPYLYFRLGYRLAKTVAKSLYRVRLGYADAEALAAVNPRSRIVFVMNHRGNMDYILKTFDPGGERDVVFIPVGINYDRVLEDRTLLAKLDPAGPRRGTLYAVARTAAFVARNLWPSATGRRYRFGYACVNFGRPISMRGYVRARDIDFRRLPEEERHREVERVAAQLMAAIAGIIPVLPVSLVATVFLRCRETPLSELDAAETALLACYANAIEPLVAAAAAPGDAAIRQAA